MLLGLLALHAAVSWLGSQFSPGGAAATAEWYRTLPKPDWTPPSAVFGPVWGALYFVTAVAAWRVWRHGAPRRTGALEAYFVQLGLNAAWSPAFFGLQDPRLGLVVLAALLPIAFVTLRRFGRVDRPAAWLFVPYFAWISFATALNLAIVLRD